MLKVDETGSDLQQILHLPIWQIFLMLPSQSETSVVGQTLFQGVRLPQHHSPTKYKQVPWGASAIRRSSPNSRHEASEPKTCEISKAA